MESAGALTTPAFRESTKIECRRIISPRLSRSSSEGVTSKVRPIQHTSTSARFSVSPRITPTVSTALTAQSQKIPRADPPLETASVRAYASHHSGAATFRTGSIFPSRSAAAFRQKITDAMSSRSCKLKPGSLARIVCVPGGGVAHGCHSSSCVISASTQSYCPLRSTAWQYSHFAPWFIAMGAPQFGQLPSMSPVPLAFVLLPRARMKDQYSANCDASSEPGIARPVATDTR